MELLIFKKLKSKHFFEYAFLFLNNFKLLNKILLSLLINFYEVNFLLKYIYKFFLAKIIIHF